MILVVEPQCYGYEHSDVNAALLAVVRGAFPTEMILFYAELSHLNLVKENTLLHKISSIEYHSIGIPNKKFSDARRLCAEWAFAKHVFHIAKGLKARRIIFASITSAGLWSIKLLIRKYRNLDVIVIPHSILESITDRPSIKKPWVFLFWFRYALIIWNMPRLRYLLFGESKGNELCEILPKLQSHVQSINLPYFFKDYKKTLKSTSTLMRFGSFGEWHNKKGTDVFFKLASEVHQKTDKNKSEFILIGHIGDPAMRKKINTELIIPSIDRPLIREKFEEYANKIDYAIFCFKPKSFRLTVSGSFYDALSYIKPIIAIKTPFFEYYFNEMGDIGYLCDDYNEILILIIDLIHNKPIKRYTEQCNNIIKGRELLGVANSSVRMRDILDGSMPF